jgi:predicted rRNA methylase YqxC with S4 and FtsJ domains
LITVDGIIGIIQARLTAAKLVSEGRVTDNQLRQARQAQIAQRAEYDAHQPQFASQAGPELAQLFAPVSIEEKINKCCIDLLTMIGFHLRNGDLPAS